MSERFKKNGKDGFASIIEVVITAVIFILATAGILSTISMLRPHGVESSRKIEAAYIGKGIIDDLRNEVHATTTPPYEYWGPNLDPDAGTYTQTQGDYTISYDVTQVNPNLRKLDMTITWPDP